MTDEKKLTNEEKAFKSYQELQELVFKSHGISGIVSSSSALVHAAGLAEAEAVKLEKSPAQVKNAVTHYLSKTFFPDAIHASKRYMGIRD